MVTEQRGTLEAGRRGHVVIRVSQILSMRTYNCPGRCSFLLLLLTALTPAMV